jgi:nitrite reductase/ring-hydroxylating ferredoxin subunit
MGRYPFAGIPSGWYVVAASAELAPGQIVGRQYFGRELVLYRTESGRLVVTDAYCPHMGAHLEAGKVEGETLRCPFHGFQYDVEGSCVATPYGKGLPRRAQLRTWLVREQSGLVLAWYDADDKLPEWGVPELPLEGWSALRYRAYDVDSHPQETTENSIDFGHFTSVHNFSSAEMTREVTTQGPLLRSGYAITATLGAIGLPRTKVKVDFDVEVWGLGYSLVNLSIAAFDVRGRIFVLPVPVDEEHIQLRLGCMTSHRFRGVGLVLREIIARAFWAEVEEDIPVWTRKKYVHPPALAPGDGPVALYRHWARQFYPEC